MTAATLPRSPPIATTAATRREQRAPTFAVHPGLDTLPQGCAEIFQSQRDIALRAEWFRNLIITGQEPGAIARFGVLESGGRPIGIVPFQEHASQGLTSLTNCYTCLYQPLIAAGVSLCETAFHLGSGLGRRCTQFASAQIDCLPTDWPGLTPFTAGLRAVGLAVRRFDHFGNWHEPLHGRSWDEYVATRPGSLREVLRRRRRRAQAVGVFFEVIDRVKDLERGIAAFEAVYRVSWKPAEPFPRFNAGLMEAAAQLGMLRLGICWRHERPIAAQLWIVVHGTATVMKLAHDESESALSPGTLLTAAMIEAMMSVGIDEIDFGRGDDPYKRLWAGHRRQRIGLLVANPRRLGGIAALARHDLGRVVRGHRATSPTDTDSG